MRDVGSPPADLRRVLAPLLVRGGSATGATVLQSVRSALRSLGAHKLRSALALLALVLGVAALLVIMAVAQLTNSATARRLAALGTNQISVQGFVIPANSTPAAGAQAVQIRLNGPPSLTTADIQLVSGLPHVLGASPNLQTGFQVTAGSHNWKTQVIGAFPAIQAVAGYTLASGAFFSDQDIASGSTVAVLGQTVVTDLFPGSSPLGQQVRIGSVNFTVVGTLQALGNNGDRDMDDTIIVPASTLLQRLMGGPKGGGGEAIGKASPASPAGNGQPGKNPVVIQAQGVAQVPGSAALQFANFPMVQVEVDTTRNVPLVTQEITKALEQAHHIPPGGQDDFQLGSFFKGAGAAGQSTTTITLVMTLIAGVTLLIGGFGIGGVMLAAVNERQREIGVRLAVGAQPRDVQMQFLIEATALATCGGLLGVILGVALEFVLPQVLRPFARLGISPSLPVIACVLAATLLIGLIFGLLPARRAANMDPVEALR